MKTKTSIKKSKHLTRSISIVLVFTILLLKSAFGQIGPYDDHNIERIATYSRYLGETLNHIDIVSYGNFAFVASEHYAGISIFDFSNPAAPEFVSNIYLYGSIGGMSITGNLLCVTNYFGVSLIDISDPTNPIITDFFETFETFDKNTGLVECTGNLVCVMTQDYDGSYLLILKINDNKQLELCSSNGPGGILLEAKDSLAYYHWQYGNTSKFSIYDVSDPYNVQNMGFYYSSPLHFHTCIDSIYLYSATTSNAPIGFVTDISDPTNPFQAGYFISSGAILNDVYAKGNYVYSLASGTWHDYYINVIDITDVVSGGFGQIVSTLTYTGSSGYKGLSIDKLNDSILLTLDTRKNIRAFNVQDVFNPVEVSSFSGSAIISSAVSDKDYVYYLETNKHLKIIDISDKNVPVLIGEIDNLYVDYNWLGYHFNMDTDGNQWNNGTFLYISNKDSLKIVDTSDPYNPIVASTIPVYGEEDIEYYQNHIYVADTSVGVTKIDVSDGYNPIVNGIFNIPQAENISVYNNYLYCKTADNNDIKIFSINNYNQVATYSPNVGNWDFAILDNHLFIHRYNIVEVADITNPGNPFFLTNFNIDYYGGPPYYGEKITCSYDSNTGQSYYYISSSQKFEVLNITDIYNVNQVGRIAGSGFNSNDVYGRYAISADRKNIHIFDLIQIEATPPTNFNLLNPVNGYICTNDSISLYWEPSTDPDTYDEITYKVIWANDENFTLNVDSALTTSNSFLLNNLNDDFEYYWKVKAQDLNTEGTWCTPASGFHFHVSIPEPPLSFNLLSPEDMTIVDTSSVLFDWVPTIDPDPDDVVTYELQLSSDSLFTTPTQIDCDTNHFYVHNSLGDDTSFFWRVLAKDENTTGTYSDEFRYFSIFIQEYPDSFNLIEPLCNTSLPNLNPEFIWEKSSDPDPGDSIYYNLNLYSLPDFDTLVENISDTTFVFSFDLSDNNQYSWEVEAVDITGRTTESNNGECLFFVNLENDPPTVINQIPDQDYDEDSGIHIVIEDLYTIFEDVDQDSLEFNAFVDGGGIIPAITSDSLYISTVQDSSGFFQVIVTANDLEYTAADTFNVIVNPVNDPPNDFQLLSPENEYYFCPVDTIIEFIWQQADDIENDEIIYSLHLTGPNVDSTFSNLNDTIFAFDGVWILQGNASYLWSITADDGNGGLNTTEYFSLNTYPVFPVSVAIYASDEEPCIGDTVVFTAIPQNGGDSPLFQWQLNGNIVGNNSPTYQTDSLSDNDEILCYLTSSENCTTNNPATSNLITMTVNPLPIVNIIPSPSDTVCISETIFLDAGNPGSTFLWSTNEVSQQIEVSNESGPGGGIQSYWVIVTDNNECEATDEIEVYFDPCTGVNTYNENSVIKIFPNPAHESISLIISNNILPSGLCITDMYGKELYCQNIIAYNNKDRSLVTIDISYLTNGIYVLKISNNEMSKYIKFIKN